MADNAAVRAWARETGYDVNERGSLPASVRAAYDAAHPSGNGDGPDYPDGMSDADFTVSATLPPDDMTETTPKSAPRPSRSKSVVAGPKSWWQRSKPKPAGKAKPKHARLPVDEVIGGAWRILARIAAPVPPLQRTLRVQAPVAGLILEDTVKGTVVDTVLQPIARMQKQGKAVAALLGPPMIVTAMSMHVQRAVMSGSEPNPVFLALGTEALRESLMIWLDVAGPKFEKALERERDFEAKYGADVDAFIAWLMSPPADPATEDEAIKRAQGFLRDE